MLIPFKKCVETYGNIFTGIVHIGAHVGEEISDYYTNGVKQVYWFEANRNLFQQLYSNTSKYPVKQEYFCEAVSDVNDDEVNFHVTNNGQSSSILELGTHASHYPHIKVVETIKLKTKRFDKIIESNPNKLSLTNIQFINLDIQGVELKALKGFGDLLDKFSGIKAIYSEVNFEEVYVGANLVTEIDEYLKQFGFNRVITCPTEYGWGDALYLRK